MEKEAPARQQDEIKKSRDLLADYYTGTVGALTAAGICKAEWFPDGLEPEFRKDGSPKIGNNGRQRYRRTYAVAGTERETTLTHRLNAGGEVIWQVRIACASEEITRREQEAQAVHDERQRKYEAAERRRRNLDDEAQPIVRRVNARYPGVLVTGGYEEDWGGELKLVLRFHASYAALRECGLVTDEMVAEERRGGFGYFGFTATGDRYSLDNTTSQDGRSRLTLTTWVYGNDWKRLNPAHAMRVLRPILKTAAPRR